jgi:hypothetical protein
VALERNYQPKLIGRIEDRFVGCFIIKLDVRQGLPDLLILFNDRWAALEVKRSSTASYQPNQEYYLELFGKMSFAATIYPSNEEAVLNALQTALGL